MGKCSWTYSFQDGHVAHIQKFQIFEAHQAIGTNHFYWVYTDVQRFQRIRQLVETVRYGFQQISFNVEFANVIKWVEETTR